MLGREDRFVGCLLGECLGDALGFIVEGHPSDVWGPYAFESIRTRECLSQPTRELFASYVARTGFGRSPRISSRA